MGSLTVKGEKLTAKPHPSQAGTSFLMLDLENSPDLEQVRSRLAPFLVNPKEWSPHITIGLVKDSAVGKYLTDKTLLGKTINFDTITINRARNAGRPETVYLDRQADMRAFESNQNREFYIEHPPSMSNAEQDSSREQSALANLPLSSQGPRSMVTLIVGGPAIERGRAVALASRLRAAGATVDAAWSGRPDIVRLTRFHEKNGFLDSRKVPAMARLVGEPAVVLRVEAGANILNALRANAGPVWEVQDGDRTKGFTEAPEITVNHPESRKVHTLEPVMNLVERVS
jgi:hypothetical protein